MTSSESGQGTPPPGADDERTAQHRAVEAVEDALLTWTATSWEHRARNVVRAIEAAGLRIVDPAAIEVGDGLMAREVAEHLPPELETRYWAAVIVRDLGGRDA